MAALVLFLPLSFGESTLGGMVVYAIYQALLTELRTEAMRRRGELHRATQIQLVA